MAPLTPAPLLALSACLWLFVLAEETQEVTVKLGADGLLTCRGPEGAAITRLIWSKSDLKSDKYVFFFRENRLYENYQLPSYHGRVELREPKMQAGDASLVLKNVTDGDVGTYQCVVSVSGRRQRREKFTHTITLRVEDSGHTAGNTEDGGVLEEENLRNNFGLILPVVVMMMVCVVLTVLVTIMYKRRVAKPPAAVVELAPLQ